MSRIGNRILTIPAGVEVNVDGNNITVKGPKGTLNYTFRDNVEVKVEDGKVAVTRKDDSKVSKQLHGTTNSNINNMLIGVSEGFKRTLLISGVGYKAQVQGNKLVLNLGLSHNVEIEVPSDLKVACPNVTEVSIEGIDKQKVGQFASKIKDLRPVEPYHGYGIRYSDQVVIRKVGKTAGKGKK